ncbi:MAG: hypothetical protein MUF00_06220 [Gemmatimonadaceae bacterium]|jgi:hypothetical protein|nr:hypothetical protein [Gemmatimonadaceae bacterium]
MPRITSPSPSIRRLPVPSLVRVIRRSRVLAAPLAVLAGGVMVAGCGGAKATPAPAPAAASASSDVASLALATREACTALIEREAAQVVSFATYSRPTDSLWDVGVRIRKEGQLTRIGCRYDVTSSRAVLYDPASPPPLPSASVTAAAPASAVAGRAASPAAPSAAATPSGTSATGVGSTPPSSSSAAPAPAPAATKPASPAPAAPPERRLAQDLSWVPDTVARAAMTRTRDGCLDAAKKQKLDIEAIDSFQREAGSTTKWEAALVSVRRNRRTTWQCTFDLSTSTPTLREVKPAR